VFAPAVPFMALIAGLLAPESPVYLMSRRKTHEARKALTRLYGPQYKIEEEMSIIENNLKALKLNRKHKTAYIKELSTHPEVYKPFFIILVSYKIKTNINKFCKHIFYIFECGWTIKLFFKIKIDDSKK